MNKTIFCDIDGCILYQHKEYLDFYRTIPVLLTGVREKLLDWHTKGYRIILTTGRPHSERESLEKMLSERGVLYSQLITDCGSGPRYLINDRGETFADKAFAININRNDGIGSIELISNQ